MSDTTADRLRRMKIYRDGRNDPVKSVVINALDQMCHGRVSFGIKQLMALVGLEDDPDYQAMVEYVAKKIH